ncbi:hypothetical protein AB6A23_13025 [Paenibacillus tarimensis]
MKISNYHEFERLVEEYKILPFSDLVPDYPSLAAVASNNNWHTGLESDPWLWRVKIVKEGTSAYGKFFGTKASFIHLSLFPQIKTVLTTGRTVKERYHDGLLSQTAYRIYKILTDQGNIDSRNLRKMAGLAAKEDKKEYEKSLNELQNFCDIVITGTKDSDNDSGWSSMCFELSDYWLSNTQLSGTALSLETAKDQLKAQLTTTCTERAYKYFAKKLRLEG